MYERAMIKQREKEIKRKEVITKQQEEEMSAATFHPVTNNKRVEKRPRQSKPKSSHNKINRVQCKEDFPSPAATNYQPMRNQNFIDAQNSSPRADQAYMPKERESPIRTDPIPMRGKGPRQAQPFDDREE